MMLYRYAADGREKPISAWVEYVQMYTVLCMTSNSKALHLNGKANRSS